jgi:hypothetical protein
MYVKVKPLRLFPYSAEGEGLRRATGSALGDEDLIEVEEGTLRGQT